MDAAFAGAARCDDRGVPLAGRRAELAALRAAGARDLSFGRIYEGHVNALQLIARTGTPAQRASARADADAGVLFGVWNTQDAGGVQLEDAETDGAVLHGAKTWASGAGTVLRPVVTAARADGSSQMCVVPMERVRTRIDRDDWRPLGMERSESFRVSFDGVRLQRDALLGEPGDYERAPWFLGGALRFTAVQTGGIERLADETARYLVGLNRDGDPLQKTRAGHLRVAVRTARAVLDAGADAWGAFDADPSDANAAGAVEAADVARVVVERAALDAIELAVRSVGARGLLEPLPFAGLVRDLQMYLRQPAPDAALLRVGGGLFADARAGEAADATRDSASTARSSDSARPVGTGG